jgi:hypothetical protein
VINLGRHEHDALYEVGVLDLHPSIECRPVHLRHAKVRENQIVDVGADSFERGMSIGNRIDLAVSIMSYRTGHEIAKERIVVNYKDARTLEASRMDVTVRATVAWFAICKWLTADRTGRAHPLFGSAALKRQSVAHIASLLQHYCANRSLSTRSLVASIS